MLPTSFITIIINKIKKTISHLAPYDRQKMFHPKDDRRCTLGLPCGRWKLMTGASLIEPWENGMVSKIGG